MGSCVSSRKGRKQVAHLPNQQCIDISHFEVLDQVGKGGFAEVYAARQVRSSAGANSKKVIALKIIPKRRVLIPRSRRRSTQVSETGDESPQSRRTTLTTSCAGDGLEYRISSSVFIERQLLENLQESPFLPSLTYAFQNTDYLYMVLPFYAGGDLQHLINRLGPLPEESIRFYAAELVLALEALHVQRIVYRDLKPRNVLLRESGHLVLTDFGLCRLLSDDPNDSIKGRAGTKGYLAPEAINGEEYRFSVDFFSLGATLYKLATKKLPFGKSENFAAREVKWDLLPAGLCELVRHLMELNQAHRLGCGPDGWDEVKGHPFFEGLDWAAAKKRKLTPPYIPTTESITANCPSSFKPSRYDRMAAAQGDTGELTEEQQRLFHGFEFRTAL